MESDAQSAILLVAHGSRNPEANRQTRELARCLGERCQGTIVRVAHLEIASPTVAEGIEECIEAGAQRIVLQPVLLTDGSHSTRDIPNLVAEAGRRHPGIEFRVGDVLGEDPRLVDILLERAEKARLCEPPAES